MAQDLKQEEGINIKQSMFFVIFKVILGLVFLSLGIWAVVNFRKDVYTVIKGCIGPFLLLAGIVVLAIARD
ncbi:MAG: hypothetical protein ABIH18_02350 [Candidatus Omnitrophota bacterium]